MYFGSIESNSELMNMRPLGLFLVEKMSNERFHVMST